jgi:V/A-type H+-transporting ATPase subunit I
MIVPMMKYGFILYHRDYEAFLARLQELGLMDITVSGWEPDEAERRLMADIDNQRTAMKELGALRKSSDWKAEKPFDTPQQTLAQTVAASGERERLRGEIARTEKEIADLRPWGEFSAGQWEQLASQGVKLHFFTAFAKDFDRQIDGWMHDFAIEKITEQNGTVYFVVVVGPNTPPVEINANEVKMPPHDWRQQENHRNELHRKTAEQEAILRRAAGGLEALDAYGAELRAALHRSQIARTAPREADNSLVLMEGWAPAGVQEQVDAFLAADETAYTIKEEPAAGDEPPVLLKNNRFARPFEIIGGFYSLPKYGTIDLTPWFAPFYMLFFGFCLADAGYGLIYLAAAIIARFKVPEQYRPYTSLVMWCAISTIFFGLLGGNAFGIALGDKPLFQPIAKYMVNSNQLFYIAVGIGVVHILYAMVLKVVFTSKLQGFVHALSSLGWIIVICSLLAAMVAPMLGLTIPGYALGTVPFWVATGIGVFLMLFMNSPGKNPFYNFGLGLWNTYNDVTGLLSDVLSYIRLFALGLSGGILALVFNRLAMEMSPDIVVLKQLVMLLILGVGQGLTLFMSSLSAFVHPLRLTFVEFYKNAGFVDGGRAFNPLKR